MQTVKLALVAAGALSILVSLIFRIVKAHDRANAWLGLGFLLLLPNLAVRAYGHLNPPTAEQLFERQFGPRELKGLYGTRFVSAGQKAGFFALVVNARHEAGERWMIDGLLDDGLTLGRWMVRHPSREPEGDVVLTARANLVDRYGNVSRQDVLTLRWAGTDWAKINWASISRQQLAELSDARGVLPAVRPAIAAWCAWNVSRWRAC